MTKNKKIWSTKKTVFLFLGILVLLSLLYLLYPPLPQGEVGTIARNKLVSKGIHISENATEEIFFFHEGPFDLYAISYKWEESFVVIPLREEYTSLKNALAETAEVLGEPPYELEMTYEEMVANREASPSIIPYRVDTYLEAKTGVVLYTAVHT